MIFKIKIKNCENEESQKRKITIYELRWNREQTKKQLSASYCCPFVAYLVYV